MFKLLKNLIGLVVAVTVIVLLGFPFWVNSAPVRNAFRAWLKAEADVDCSFERISGWPWGAVSVRGVNAAREEKPGEAGFDFVGDVNVRVDLSSLISGDIRTEKIELTRVKIDAKLPVEPPEGVEDRGLHKTYELSIPRPVKMELADGNLRTLERLAFVSEGNEFWTSGEVDMNGLTLDFDFGGDNVDQRFINKVRENPYSPATMPLPDAVFEVEGSITGPLTNPRTSGSFESKEIDSQGFWPEAVSGEFAYASEVTEVDELKISMWDGELEGRLKLDDRGDKDLYELELSGASLQIGPLLDRFSLEAGIDVPLKLGVNGSLSFSGTLKDPLNSTGTMSFRGAGGTAEFGGNAIALEDLNLDFRMGGREIRLNTGRMDSDALTVRSSGIIKFNGSSPGNPGIEFKDVSIRISGEDIGRLIPVEHPLKNSVTGALRGTLGVNGGTARNPLAIDVDGTLTSGTLYRVSLLDVDMDLEYHKIELAGRSSTSGMRIDRFDVDSPAGTVQLTGDVEYAGPIDLSGRAKLSSNYLRLHPDLKSQMPSGFLDGVEGIGLKLPELHADLSIGGTMAQPKFNWGDLIGGALEDRLMNELEKEGSGAVNELLELLGR